MLKITPDFFFQFQLNKDWIFRIERVEVSPIFPLPDKKLILKYVIHVRIFIPTVDWRVFCFYFISNKMSNFNYFGDVIEYPQNNYFIKIETFLNSINPDFESIITNKLKEFEI